MVKLALILELHKVFDCFLMKYEPWLVDQSQLSLLQLDVSYQREQIQI